MKLFRTREEARMVARTCTGWVKVRTVRLETGWALIATPFSGARVWLQEADFPECQR